MPELPEVETFRRKLLHGADDSPSIMGMKIERVDLLWDRTLEIPSPAVFKSQILEQTVQDIGRRGKYLLIHLTTDTLAIHLRMSGDLIVEKDSDPIAKHHRLIIYFDTGYRLAFNNPRKFGRAWLTNDSAALLSHLGPEPLSDSFTPEIFYLKLSNRRRQIKSLLLDQTFMAGLGNIYTDEALFYARIHPQSLANTIAYPQAEKLWEGIRKVLTAGIERHGSSIDWMYRGGKFQNQFQVYQRTGESCYHCGTTIERIIVGQRSTHFCPQCQPAINS